MKKTVTALVAAVGLLTAGCGSDSPAEKKDTSSSYVTAVQQNANATARDTDELIDDISGVGDGSVDIDTFGAHAQALHDHLDDFYQQTLTTGQIDNDDQAHFGVAIKDLRDAASAGVTFSKSSGGANAQSFGSKLGEARAEWNAAVNTLWRSAGVSPVPTIKAVSS